MIAAAGCERPTEPVADGIDVTRAEFEYAVTHEGALTVEDILDRRTRIGLVAQIDRERGRGRGGVAHRAMVDAEAGDTRHDRASAGSQRRHARGQMPLNERRRMR